MLIRRSVRYRIYPSLAQKARLASWESGLRWLWNLGNEQRWMGLQRTDKRYPTAFDQINDLTDLREALPWFRDIPRCASEQLLVALDKAWQCYLRRITKAPRWKKQGRDFPGIAATSPSVWHIVDGNAIKIPKIGNVRAVIHVPLPGKPKTCVFRRDGDQWFAHVVCEVQLPDPVSRSDNPVGIDRGVTNAIADSLGSLVINPRFHQRILRRIARAQRTVSRRKAGSKNQIKAKAKVMRMHRKARRQREYFLHAQTTEIAKSHGVVVIERLHTAGMMRGLVARGISDSGWAILANMLRYKLAWSGGSLIEVPAHYSSQTCAACGHVDALSRRKERFCCVSCRHTDHADVNAAKVILSRANRSALPMEGSPLEGTPRSGKATVKLRVPRRPSSQKHQSLQKVGV